MIVYHVRGMFGGRQVSRGGQVGQSCLVTRGDPKLKYYVHIQQQIKWKSAWGKLSSLKGVGLNGDEINLVTSPWSPFTLMYVGQKYNQPSRKLYLLLISGVQIVSGEREKQRDGRERKREIDNFLCQKRLYFSQVCPSYYLL